MPKIEKAQLKMCHWNVEGLKDQVHGIKTNNPAFQQEITNFDVIALTETHANADKTIDLEGYTSFQVNRPRHVRAKKDSGGIAILVKSSLRSGIAFHSSASPDIAWLKLKKEKFSLEYDVYVGVVYLAPSNSTYSMRMEEESIEILEREMLKYSEKGKIILMGDFNARTGEMNEENFGDKFDDNIFVIEDTCNDIQKRKSDDKIISATGKKVLELCTNANLRILNGRVLGDLCGRITCHQWNGCSVVDYGIVDRELLTYVDWFRVHEFNGLFSNHCKISMSIGLNHSTEVNTITLNPFPRGYKWNENSTEAFSNAMKDPKIQNKLKHFECDNKINDKTKQVNINQKVTEFTQILLDAADISLLRRKQNSRQNKIKNQRNGII